MRSDIAGLRSANLPTMLLLDAASSPHFVVVTQLKERVATLFDPAQGWHSVDLMSLQSHWLGANSTGVYVQFMR
jgi:ABC-type bacteriocin/lantibiotic exporter with double-glycine peptidase domain